MGMTMCLNVQHRLQMKKTPPTPQGEQTPPLLPRPEQSGNPSGNLEPRDNRQVRWTQELQSQRVAGEFAGDL